MISSQKISLLSILVALIGSPFSILFAQDIPFKNYGIEDGLPQSDILTMQQDKYGHIWFGTAEGLASFNGMSYRSPTKFNISRGFSHG